MRARHDPLGPRREVQTQTGVPIVSLFYDGEAGRNQRLEIFLAGRSARKNAWPWGARSLHLT